MKIVCVILTREKKIRNPRHPIFCLFVPKHLVYISHILHIRTKATFFCFALFIWRGIKRQNTGKGGIQGCLVCARVWYMRCYVIVVIHL